MGQDGGDVAGVPEVEAADDDLGGPRTVLFQELTAALGEDTGAAFADERQQNDEVRFGAAKFGGVVAGAHGPEEGGLEACLFGGRCTGQREEDDGGGEAVPFLGRESQIEEVPEVVAEEDALRTAAGDDAVAADGARSEIEGFAGPVADEGDEIGGLRVEGDEREASDDEEGAHVAVGVAERRGDERGLAGGRIAPLQQLRQGDEGVALEGEPDDGGGGGGQGGREVGVAADEGEAEQWLIGRGDGVDRGVREADLAFEELEDFRREVFGRRRVEAAELGIEGAHLAVAGGDHAVEFIFDAAEIADVGIEAPDGGREFVELGLGLGAFAAQPAEEFTAEGPDEKQAGVKIGRGGQGGADRKGGAGRERHGQQHLLEDDEGARRQAGEDTGHETVAAAKENGEEEVGRRVEIGPARVGAVEEQIRADDRSGDDGRVEGDRVRTEDYAQRHEAGGEGLERSGGTPGLLGRRATETVAGDGEVAHEGADGFLRGRGDRGEGVADVGAAALPESLAGGGVDQTEGEADGGVAVEVGFVAILVDRADEEMGGTDGAGEFGVAAVRALGFVGGGAEQRFLGLEQRQAGFDECAAGHFGEGAPRVLIRRRVDEGREEEAFDAETAGGTALSDDGGATGGEDEEAESEEADHGSEGTSNGGGVRKVSKRSERRE